MNTTLTRPAQYRGTTAAVIASLLAAVSGASAQEIRPPAGPSNITAVIELFTSQGCSSCPPADALLKTYAAKPGILALEMPVDYWDYLGWKDTFASPKNTERQRNYAKARGDGHIYTPQAVINGMLHVNGASMGAIETALTDTETKLAIERVPLSVWTERGSIVIQAGAAPDGAAIKEATIWLAVIQKTAEVSVAQGENKGKTLSYTNVVRELTPVGTWTGTPIRVQLARSALMRPQLETVAVLLQNGKAGPIIAAAVTGLW
jgi:hypothetical protein